RLQVAHQRRRHGPAPRGRRSRRGSHREQSAVSADRPRARAAPGRAPTPAEPGARRALRPSGAVVLETAGEVQATAAATLLRAWDFSRVEMRADLAGVTRFV